jgi:hypothetical protein
VYLQRRRAEGHPLVAKDRIWSPERGFGHWRWEGRVQRARQGSRFGRSGGNSEIVGEEGAKRWPGARSHYAAYRCNFCVDDEWDHD